MLPVVQYVTKSGEIRVHEPVGMDMSYGDFKRLLGRAREEGVRIFKSFSQQEFFATSVSQPGIVHNVWPSGCDCRGFTFHGRCKHMAALLNELGEDDNAAR